jgi:Mg-chelatase subunit ChlD
MNEISITFVEPKYLLLLVPLIPFVLVYGLRTMWRLPAPVQRLAIAVRLVVVVLLVLAISQPILGRLSDSLAVVFAVDVSDSTDQTARQQALDWIKESVDYRFDDDQYALITFAKAAHFVAPMSRDWTRLDEVADLDVPEGTADASDVAEAIHMALAAMPPDGGKRIIVISDGNANGPSAEKVARIASSRRVQLSAAALRSPAFDEVWIEAIDVPSYVREGEQYDLNVLVRSTIVSSGRLRLWMDDRMIAESNVELARGLNHFNMILSATDQGFHQFGAQIDPDSDTFDQNNMAFGYVVIKDQGNVLLIVPEGLDPGRVEDALTQAGVKVQIQPPSFIPSRLSAMKDFDAMVLMNVAAGEFTYDQAQTVVHFAGGLGRGLVVVGGGDSLSLGQYAQSPIAQALPVAMMSPSRLEKGSIGLVLVIDKSGSMDAADDDGVQKIAMAREAAIKTLNVLSNVDVLGVLSFDTEVQWVVLPEQITDQSALDGMTERIATLEASGGTEIHNALVHAFNAAIRLPVRFKHIILYSDGRSLTESEYGDLLTELRSTRVTLSTIAIGQDADLGLMEYLARQGNGRYYFSEDASDVPQITTRETRIASGSSAVDGDFQPVVVSASPILKSIRPADLPQLGGYVVTTSKPNSNVAITSDRSDPILAHWRYGLGRVAVWTSDLESGWASKWLDWADFDRFWAQTVRWTMRAPADPNLNVSSSVKNDEVTLTVDLLDDAGLFMDLQDIRVSIPQDNEASLELAMDQVRPGRYETIIQSDQPGAYQFQVAHYRDGNPIREEIAGFIVPTPAEYRHFGTDFESLSRMVEAGGGRLLQDPKEAFRRDAVFEGRQETELWYLLLLAAALLFPVDVAVRRLKLSFNMVALGSSPFIQRARRTLRRSE